MNRQHTGWAHLADTLGWSPGHTGKGYLLANGTIRTWNIDVYEPESHREHWERQHELSPSALNFEIDPDGGLVTAEPTTKVQALLNADSRLYDAGRRPVFEDDFNLDNWHPTPNPQGKPDLNFVMSAVEDESWSFNEPPRTETLQIKCPLCSGKGCKACRYMGFMQSLPQGDGSQYPQWESASPPWTHDPHDWQAQIEGLEPRHGSAGSFAEHPESTQWRINLGHDPEHVRDWMARHYPAVPMQALHGYGSWNGVHGPSTALHLYDTPTPLAQQLVNHFGRAHPHTEAFGIEPLGAQSFLYHNPHVQPVPEQGSWDFGESQLPLGEAGSVNWEHRPYKQGAWSGGYNERHGKGFESVAAPGRDHRRRWGADVPPFAEIDPRAEAARYYAAFDRARAALGDRAGYVSRPDPEELADKRVFMGGGDLSSYSISPTGEFGNVWRHPDAQPGVMPEMVAQAVGNGAKWLNAYDDPRLIGLYQRFGFTPQAWVERDPGEGPHDVTFMTHGAPAQPKGQYVDWDMAEQAAQNAHQPQSITVPGAESYQTIPRIGAWQDEPAADATPHLGGGVPVRYHPTIDPRAPESHDGYIGYAGRWPTIWDGTALHVGPEGSTHAQVLKAGLGSVPSIRDNGPFYRSGWVGHNPEAYEGRYEGADDREEFEDNGLPYGWYGNPSQKDVPPAVTQAMLDHHRTFMSSPQLDPNEPQGYGHAQRMLGGWEDISPLPNTGYRALGSVDSRTATTRSLYHGTLRDHLDDIRRFGLQPGVGDFVSDAYDLDENGMYDQGDEQPYSSEDLGIAPVVFMADKQRLHKALNAIRHNVAKKLDKPFHEVTPLDVRQHGLLVKQPGEMGWSDDPTSDKHGQLPYVFDDRHQGEVWEDTPAYQDWNQFQESPPYQAEPGDFYSDSQVGPSGLQFIHGPALMRVLQQQLGWPQRPEPPQQQASPTVSASIPDTHMIAPATELREWLADFGAADPAPSIHHADELDFIEAPASTTRELPYFPPANVPKEYKQAGWRGSSKTAAPDRGSVDINAGWRSPFEGPATYDPAQSDPHGLAPLKDLVQKLDTQWAAPLAREGGYATPEEVKQEWSRFQNDRPDEAQRMREAVANVIVGACLSPKTSLEQNAQQYQDILAAKVPWDCTDPNVYWKALENARQSWNVARGYHDDIHRPWNVGEKNVIKDPSTGKKRYLSQPPRMKSFVEYLMKPSRAHRRGLDKPTAHEEAKRMVNEWKTQIQTRLEEQNAGQPDWDKELTDNVSNKAVCEILDLVIHGQRRTKPEQAFQQIWQQVAAAANEPHDFGPEYEGFANQKMFNEYKYGAFMGTSIQAICQLKRHLDDLIEAALVDVHYHNGVGHHFRAQVLKYDVSGIGPKLASFMWLLLQPLTSQLGTIDTHMANVLGHKLEVLDPKTGEPKLDEFGNPKMKSLSNRDFFQAERELRSYRDLMGMSDVPLGQFQWLIWDLQRSGASAETGLPRHQDHEGLRVLDPPPNAYTQWLPKLIRPPMAPVFNDWRDQVQSVTDDYRRNVLGENDEYFAKKDRGGRPQLQWAQNAIPTQMTWPRVIN